MIEQDTVKLLRECDAGVKTGIRSLDNILIHANSKDLENILIESKTKHDIIDREIHGHLRRLCDDGKEPAAVAVGMSWLKTNLKLALNDSDATVAGIITDGCNMGVKSLNKYLNKYKAADEKSKDIAKKLINVETDLIQNVRAFL